MKKIVSICVVALILIYTTFTLSAVATVNGTCGENLTWTLDGKGVLTISCNGKMEDWMSEGSVSWREHRNKIVTVIVESGVTSIGERAFCNCENLKNITISEGVTSIEEGAFESCNNLTGIIVAESNEYYSSDENGVLFDKNKITLICYPAGKTETEYIIPDSVTTLGEFAFSDCSGIENIMIPDSVKFINEYAFYGCSSLTDVYYGGTEEQWKAVEIEIYNEPLINAIIHFEGSNVSVNKDLQITLAGETSDGFVYAALYDGKKLKGIKKYVAAKNINASFASVKEGNIVRVFWWKNNMQPICSEAVIVK